MATTYTKQLLGNSTNGRPIKVAATATAGTLIHTATAAAGSFDEIWLYVTNTDAAAVTLTLEFGGVTSPDDHICKAVSIPANSGPICIVPGLLLNGGVAARAFASSANKLLISGFVNRITTA